jgi:hypothetical protein
VIAAIPSEYPLAQANTPISIKRFAGEDAIMFPQNIAPDLFDEIIGWCRQAGFSFSYCPRDRTYTDHHQLGFGRPGHCNCAQVDR